MVLHNDTDPVELATQSWIMYSVGMALIVLRMGAQIKRHGLKGLKPDDYLMCLTAGFYTALIVTLIGSVSGVGGNGFTADVVATWTDAEKKEHIKNAILVQVCEQFMLATVYSVKVCMLLIYGRLTMGLKERFAVKLLAGYVALGFIGTELSMFLLCRPYNQYWAIPPNDIDQCAFYRKYSLPQAVFNISSDSLMLAIPLPLVIRSHLPTKQKIAMVLLFSMGLFVIIAGIMSKSFALLPQNLDNIVYAFWYLREASVAVYVANMPLLWPMIRVITKFITREKDTTVSKSTGNSAAYELRTRKMQSQRLPNEETETWDQNSSQEMIVDRGVIFKNQTFEVQVTENKNYTKSRVYDEREHGENVYRVDVDSKS
ncbi:hypothetical protein V501_02224 [Pseudogymnoascus sp. VKM F-4519 (FW-2642)]|nr:hypothetical protein V501_02224 [Pseudogymnoascus sp. VKM F-4519 (FW-2642)]